MCETWKSNLTTTNQFGIHPTVCFIFLIQYDPIRNLIWWTRHSMLSHGKHVTQFDQESYLANTLPDLIRNLIWWTRHSMLSHGKHITQFDQEFYLANTLPDLIRNLIWWTRHSMLSPIKHVTRYHQESYLFATSFDVITCPTRYTILSDKKI